MNLYFVQSTTYSFMVIQSTSEIYNIISCESRLSAKLV